MRQGSAGGPLRKLGLPGLHPLLAELLDVACRPPPLHGTGLCSATPAGRGGDVGAAATALDQLLSGRPPRCFPAELSGAPGPLGAAAESGVGAADMSRRFTNHKQQKIYA